MQPNDSRRFSTGMEISKLLVIVASYLPYGFLREADVLGVARWVLIAVGAYLSLALVLRNLTAMAQRLPTWARWAWLAGDFTLWWFSQTITHWDTVSLFPGLVLMADATMFGWGRWRGSVPFAVTALLCTLGPLLAGFREGRNFWVNWVLVLTPSYFLIYGMIYLAGRLGEERDAADRARREAELANAHLREYAGQVEELAVLRERTRVAREVHDTVAHGFTGIIMQLEAATRMLKRSPETAELALLQIQEQARESLAEVRRSVHALRPLQMEERKGVAALERLVEEFGRTTGVRADLVVEGVPVELPAGHDLCLYRTVQEGLTNAFRHGRVGRARVRLRFHPDTLVAAVEDDGRTAAAPQKPGMGILGIRERAEVLGGRVEAGAAPTGGFVLQLTLPLAGAGGVTTA